MDAKHDDDDNDDDDDDDHYRILFCYFELKIK